jgi:hypothetical protein
MIGKEEEKWPPIDVDMMTRSRIIPDGIMST